MSLDAIAAPAPAPTRWPLRAALAAAAVLLVAGGLALAWHVAAPAIPARPARNPFGVGLREAAPSASGLGRYLIAWQSAFYTALRSGLSALKASGGGLAWLLGVGFAYGVFHAAGPGHGKAIIASYIVSSERALRRGLALSLAAALIQAAVAVALVTAVFAAVGGTAATMDRTANAVEMAGFALVAALGAALVWRKAGKLLAVSGFATPAGPSSCACSHVDPALLAGGSVRDMAAVALGAGIRPCAGAIVILTFARAQGMFAAGIAATLAMALGTAVTTGALAALAVYAKRSALRLAGGRGQRTAILGAAAELVAASFVLVVGVMLVLGLWDGAGAS